MIPSEARVFRTRAPGRYGPLLLSIALTGCSAVVDHDGQGALAEVETWDGHQGDTHGYPIGVWWGGDAQGAAVAFENGPQEEGFLELARPDMLGVAPPMSISS